MSIDSKKPRYLNPSEAAARLMISPVTLRHWALAGRLAFVTTPGGHRRFSEQEIDRFASEAPPSLKNPRDGNSKQIGESHRILIVDDDRQISGLLVEMLHGLPDSVETDIANDGFEAGQKILSFQPHTVLLDVMMPGIKGFDVCQKIKENPVTQNIRVVVMTGFSTPENMQKALDAGADICLTKPLDKTQLFKAILLGEEKLLAVSV